MIDHDQYAANPASAAQLCRVWTAHVDALERYLDRMEDSKEDQATPRKRKTRRKR